MKRRVFALALAVLLTLGGCSLPGDPAVTPTPSPTPSPTPEPVETVFSLPCYPEDGFHPITGANRTNLLLAPLVYEGLFALDETFTPHEALCEDWTVSEDGLVWTFTLRSATFSDGSPLTADDAAYSLTLAMGSELYGERLRGIRAVSAPAEDTLVLTLHAPNGGLRSLLDVPFVREGAEGEPPLGTGDYALIFGGEHWLLRRVSPVSEGSSAPVEIPLYSIRQTDDLIYAFDAQNISLVSTDLTGTNSLGFSGSFETWDYPTTTLLYVGLRTDGGPCAEQAVRQALLYGFDRSAVVSSLLSRHAQAATLPIHPDSPLYDQDLAGELEFSYQTMEQRLEEAGWVLSDAVRVRGREQLTLTFLVNSENTAKRSIAEHLSAGLERAGVAVELKVLPWEDYMAALERGNFDLYLGEVRLTADFDLSPLLSSGGSLNYGGYADAETDTLLAAFRAAAESSRPAAAADLCAHLAQTVPLVPLCFKNGSVLTHWGDLSGLTPTQQNVFYGFDGWEL